MKIDYKTTRYTCMHVYMYINELKYNESPTRAHLLCPMNELPFSLCIYSYGNCKSHWAFDKFKLTVWLRSIVVSPPTIPIKYRMKVTREDVELVSQSVLHIFLWSTIYFFSNFYRAAWYKTVCTSRSHVQYMTIAQNVAAIVEFDKC